MIAFLYYLEKYFVLGAFEDMGENLTQIHRTSFGNARDLIFLIIIKMIGGEYLDG